jgi:hypothetical protein
MCCKALSFILNLIVAFIHVENYEINNYSTTRCFNSESRLHTLRYVRLEPQNIDQTETQYHWLTHISCVQIT